MIVVLADDLSGAAELAGLAVQHGHTAEVHRRFDPATRAGVIAVDTGTRAQPAAAAGPRVRQLAETVLAARPDWVYLKTDSVLRGHVRAELDALRLAAGRTRAVLIPANPSRGRVLRDGRYFIQGTPLDQTAFAQDPEFPRWTSDVTELLGVAGAPDWSVPRSSQVVPNAGVTVPDATEPAHLRAWAEALDAHTLAAGAADFFGALLSARNPRSTVGEPPSTGPGHPPVSTTLLVCGSAAAWPHRRPVGRPPTGSGFTLAEGARDWPGRISAALTAEGRALVAIGDVSLAPGQTPAALVAAFAREVAPVIERARPGRVLLEGGATAAAVLDALGWERFTVHPGAPAGIGCLQPVGQAGPRLFLKPGSYPWPPELWC